MRIVFVVKARTPLRKWLGASFLVTYLENVVAFPAAMFGDERYLWLLGHPDTTLYLSIVLVSVAATLAGFFVFTHRRPQLRLFDSIPPLRASTSSLRLGSMVFSTACALASIVMSASGYFGYFTATAYLYSPPVWLDTARSVIGIGGGTLFVLFVAAGAAHRRFTAPEWSVAALWSLAGVASGFKTMVVLPFFYILLAAWLTGRLRLRHVAVFVASLMVAYALVEPLRGLRLSVSEDNALEGLTILVSEDLVTRARSPTCCRCSSVESTTRRLALRRSRPIVTVSSRCIVRGSPRPTVIYPLWHSYRGPSGPISRLSTTDGNCPSLLREWKPTPSLRQVWSPRICGWDIQGCWSTRLS